jgi:serine/threonine protein kinase
MTVYTTEEKQTTPAEKLTGMRLVDGWSVVRRVTRAEDATGGHFSVGYIVEDERGGQAFLKALDFSRLLLEAPDPLTAMKAVSAIAEHERRLLEICKENRLSRVVTPITEGIAVVDNRLPGGRVNYFIFDLAVGDAQAHMRGNDAEDVTWKLRSLHHVATALDQLHRHETAHQDVKPSNVLDYGQRGVRLADMGRASNSSLVAPHDSEPVAGDMAYAPLELLYREIDADWTRRRYGCDAYLLGSLVVSFFANVSITAWIQAAMDQSLRWYNWGDTYRSALPFVRNAYDDRMAEFSAILGGISRKLERELLPVVKQLCDPDPLLRGDPRNRGSVVSQLSLTRYVSYFNRIARLAELSLL